MKPKKIIGKWQFVLTAGDDFRYRGDGWNVADIGIFKLNSLPRDGERPSKRNYTGFWLRFRFWVPFAKF